METNLKELLNRAIESLKELKAELKTLPKNPDTKEMEDYEDEIFCVEESVYEFGATIQEIINGEFTLDQDDRELLADLEHRALDMMTYVQLWDYSRSEMLTDLNEYIGDIQEIIAKS